MDYKEAVRVLRDVVTKDKSHPRGVIKAACEATKVDEKAGPSEPEIAQTAPT